MYPMLLESTGETDRPAGVHAARARRGARSSVIFPAPSPPITGVTVPGAKLR